MEFPVGWWRAPTARRHERGTDGGGALPRPTVFVLSAALWVPLALVATPLALTGVLLATAGALWRCVSGGAARRMRTGTLDRPRPPLR